MRALLFYTKKKISLLKPSKGLFSLEGRYFNMMHCLIKYEGFTNTL